MKRKWQMVILTGERIEFNEFSLIIKLRVILFATLSKGYIYVVSLIFQLLPRLNQGNATFWYNLTKK